MSRVRRRRRAIAGAQNRLAAILDQGQLAFDRVCQTCHGAGARGGAGPGLAPFSRDYDELLGIVREGAGEMPPISARELSDEGVAQVLAYLKSLSR